MDYLEPFQTYRNCQDAVPVRVLIQLGYWIKRYGLVCKLSIRGLYPQNREILKTQLAIILWILVVYSLGVLLHSRLKKKKNQLRRTVAKIHKYLEIHLAFRYNFLYQTLLIFSVYILFKKNIRNILVWRYQQYAGY